MASNYYAVLELDEHASDEDIRRSYRRLALRYHPDKAGPEGAAHFKEIAAAYAVLSDPAKRRVYDRYGQTGIAAMDTPMAASAEAVLGARVALPLVTSLLFVLSTMLLLFVFFLGAFVDERLSRQHAWTYVKVFAPLFVVCGFVLLVLAVAVVPVAVVESARCCRKRHTASSDEDEGSTRERVVVAVQLWLRVTCVLCAMVLIVLVPVAKDRNEARTVAGRTDWVSWRVWLFVPGYVALLCIAVPQLANLTRTPVKAAQLRASGMRVAAVYVYVSVLLRLLVTLCAAVLLALVACRADDVLSISYFVVLGLPVYVAVAAWVADMLGGALAVACVHQLVDDDAGSNSNSNNHAGSADDAHNDSRASATTTSVTGEMAHRTLQRDEHVTVVHVATADGSGGGSSSNADTYSGAGVRGASATAAASPSRQQGQQGRTRVRFVRAYAQRIVIAAVVCILLGGLVCACVSMLCVRLDFYARHGSYVGTLSLMRALAPVYVMVCAVEAVLLLLLLITCCCATAMTQAAMAAEEDNTTTPVAAAADEHVSSSSPQQQHPLSSTTDARKDSSTGNTQTTTQSAHVSDVPLQRCVSNVD